MERIAHEQSHRCRSVEPNPHPSERGPRESSTIVQSRALLAILSAGFACGILDIAAAFLTWSMRGVTPFRLLQAIASGFLGAAAFRDGWPAALLGAICHLFIAFSAATIFYAASRKLRFLTRRPIFSGIAYGVCVYLMMYWIVMPLSRLTPMPFSLSRTVVAIVIHMICVGLPISLAVRHYSI